MTADVRIVTADLRNALRVPVEALRYWPASMPKPTQIQSQAQTVWTLKDGHPLAVPVGAGLSDDIYAQITSGALRPGEPVIIGERSGNGTATSSAAAPRRRSPFL
jgi:multidrug efflux pump subunit AcrA (membrane-fusion protein)